MLQASLVEVISQLKPLLSRCLLNVLPKKKNKQNRQIQTPQTSISCAKGNECSEATRSGSDVGTQIQVGLESVSTAEMVTSVFYSYNTKGSRIWRQFVNALLGGTRQGGSNTAEKSLPQVISHPI